LARNKENRRMREGLGARLVARTSIGGAKRCRKEIIGWRGMRKIGFNKRSENISSPVSLAAN
jgi:hypothetical protein